MRFVVYHALALFVLSSATPLIGDVTAIHAAALPQTPAVLAALDDARELEPYSKSWSDKWKFPIPKDQVATRLSKDLALLEASLKENPDNTELLLLTGLVAHYAYNLDVNGSHEASIQSLDKEVKLAPSDLRGSWFRAALVCQTGKPTVGAEELISIEDSHPWQQLPIGFWSDYIECLHVVDMPAHVLRALDHLSYLHAPDSAMRSTLTDVENKRFQEVDISKVYQGKEAWSLDSKDDSALLTGTACGLTSRIRGDWRVEQLVLSKGICVALFGTGPYQATVEKLSPSILIMVRKPQEGQTLKDFLDGLTAKYKFESLPVNDCPSQACLARTISQDGAYGKNGGQAGRVLVFERDEPEFSGLVLETIRPLEVAKGKDEVQYFRPNRVLKRMPGRLYYAILLDVAASIQEPALKDYEFVLKNLTVE